MKKRYALFIILLAVYQFSSAQDAELSGKVKEAESAEPLASAAVKYAKGKGVITDAVGKYVLTLPAGEYEIAFSSIGYKTERKKVTLAAGEKQTLDINLKSDAFKLN